MNLRNLKAKFSWVVTKIKCLEKMDNNSLLNKNHTSKYNKSWKEKAF